MDRYDIPKSEIQNTGRNVIIGLPLYAVVDKYEVSGKESLPISTTERYMNKLEGFRTC